MEIRVKGLLCSVSMGKSVPVKSAGMKGTSSGLTLGRLGSAAGALWVVWASVVNLVTEFDPSLERSIRGDSARP